MDNQQRISLIKERLQNQLDCNELQVIDESHLHIGHEGAKSGAGHFALIISCDELKAISRVNAHRKIYQLLGDLIPTEIHALRITIQ